MFGGDGALAHLHGKLLVGRPDLMPLTEHSLLEYCLLGSRL